MTGTWSTGLDNGNTPSFKGKLLTKTTYSTIIIIPKFNQTTIVTFLELAGITHNAIQFGNFHNYLEVGTNLPTTN